MGADLETRFAQTYLNMDTLVDGVTEQDMPAKGLVLHSPIAVFGASADTFGVNEIHEAKATVDGNGMRLVGIFREGHVAFVDVTQLALTELLL